MAVTLAEMQTYKRLVAVGNSKLYYEGTGVSAGSFTELDTSGYPIDTTDQLQMFEAFQKIFVVNGSKLGVADFINTKLTHTALTTQHAKGVTLTQATSNATMTVDFTNTAKTATYGYVTAGTFNTSNSVSDLAAGGGTAFTPTGINGMLTHTTLTTAHATDDVLTQATSNATMTVEYTDTAKTHTWGRITSGTFDTTHQVTGSGSGTAFTPTATNTRPPLWYAWTVYPGGASGTMPAKAYLGCLYRGRCVLSGNPNAPNQWYMTRIANPYDWDYSATDAMSAVAGQDADAGELGDIIRALIPYKDDILIFGCATSMWYLRGDPMSGGSIDSFDLTVGIFGANSWCIDGEGSFYFWGSGGIYRSSIEGGVISKPLLITGLLLPDIIKDTAADPSTHRICMGYDRKRLGIVITITKLSDGTNTNWWYDLRTQGFFPESYPTSSGAYSLFNYQANDPTYSDLLIGCKDGYVRKFNDSLKSDNTTADSIGTGTTAISSYVGMVQQLGDAEDTEGRLNSLTITTAGGASGGGFSDTDNVSYELHRANNAETAWEDMIDGATAQETGSITTTGRQNRVRKRVKGAYLGLKFYNTTADKSWALEKITGEVLPAGKVK